MGTILIVDDVQTDRELIGRVVQQTGHKPEYATDGSEALSRAKEVRPQLIFLDVVMPSMNGFHACRKLKTDPEPRPHAASPKPPTNDQSPIPKQPRTVVPIPKSLPTPA